MGILADSYEFSPEEMRRRRADSVRNVKQTNGRLSFCQKVSPQEVETEVVADKWLD